ncbi:MAG TPA: sigma-70 family RNA polymerase sigma factor [Vicinamibacterales bacterium]
MSGLRRTRPQATPSPAPPAADAGGVSAGTIRGLLGEGRLADAREAFDELVRRHQRRASRIALMYLRDPAEADEAVQDAFVRAFTRLDTYRDEHPFEVWFTRILVNACVDRQRARQRRLRRLTPIQDLAAEPPAGRHASPERRATNRAWRDAVQAAVEQLPARQREVFILCHLGDHTPRDVSMMTGMRESTVRVHLFRAVHKLRAALGAWRDLR